MKPRSNRNALIGLAVGVVFALIAGYLLLIAPKRHEASRLAREIEDVRAQLDAAQAPAPKPAPGQAIRVADLFRLSRAMPDTADIPDVLLQLSQIAQETGITFKSVTPAPVQSGSSYQVLPIDLVFDGHFYDLADFLYRLRNLVGVHAGTLSATGRLFAVESISFNEGDVQFPAVQATIRVDAFVYGSGAVPSPLPAPSGAVAAPAAPVTTTTVPSETGPLPIPTIPTSTTSGTSLGGQP